MYLLTWRRFKSVSAKQHHLPMIRQLAQAEIGTSTEKLSVKIFASPILDKNGVLSSAGTVSETDLTEMT